MEGDVLVAKDHKTLWTKESYGDFILDLEFKVAKESNSGVFLRSSDIKNVLKALEIQVHESTDGTKYGMVGAIYDAMPPAKSVAKPIGEWNRMTITCKDSKITVILNGEEIIKADLNKWPEEKQKPRWHAEQIPRRAQGLRPQGPYRLPRPARQGAGPGVVSQRENQAARLSAPPAGPRSSIVG